MSSISEQQQQACQFRSRVVGEPLLGPTVGEVQRHIDRVFIPSGATTENTQKINRAST